MKVLDRLTVPNAAAWAHWLTENGSTSKGVSLTLAKKGTREPTSLSRDEAVEEALCHGWIDGQVNTLDQKTYMQRYTPRAAKSIWSKRNVGLVERLENDGRMQDAGRAAVEAAKQDGRWQRAYDGKANLDEMQDLLKAIEASPAALESWRGLSRGLKSQVYFRLSVLKTEAGRAKHIRDYVAKLELDDAGGSALVGSQPTKKSRKRADSSEYDQQVRESSNQQPEAKKTRSGRHVRPPASWSH